MDKLPDELNQFISSFCDDKTRRIMRICNKRWFNAIGYSDFTFYFTRKSHLAEITRRLSKYTRPIGLTFQKPIDLDISALTNEISILTHLTALAVHSFSTDVTDRDKNDWLKLTTLTNLQRIALNKAPKELLRNLTHLTSLEIKLENDTEMLAPFTRLKSLTILDALKNMDGLNAHASDQLTFLHLPGVWQTDSLDLQITFNLNKFTKLKQLIQWGTGCALDLTGISSLEHLLSDTKDIFGMANNSNLTSVCLNVNENVESTQKLSKLESLTLWNLPQHTQPANIFSGKNCLTQLAVELSSNTDLSSVGSSLRSLSVYSTQEFNYDGIAQLTALEELMITESRNSDLEYKQLSHFSTLTGLELHNDGGETYELHHLPSLNNLKRLKLTNVTLDYSLDLTPATKLETFELIGIDLAFHQKQCLLHMTNLTNLAVNAAHGFDPMLLCNMKKLKVLEIRNHDWWTPYWTIFQYLTALEHLSMECRMNTDDLLPSLTGLQHLTRLTFPSNKMSLSELTRLTNLQRLDAKEVPQELVRELKDKMPYFGGCTASFHS